MDGAAWFRTQEGNSGAFAPLTVAEPRRATYATRARPTAHSATRAEADSLGDAIRQLRLALSVVTVAIAALRKQNADNDADVAEVLERYASDCLDMQIERLEALLVAVTRAS